MKERQNFSIDNQYPKPKYLTGFDRSVKFQCQARLNEVVGQARPKLTVRTDKGMTVPSVLGLKAFNFKVG